MPDVLGGELSFSARIDVEQLKKDQQDVKASVAKTVADITEANTAQAAGINKVAKELKELQATNSTAGFDKQKAAAASLGDTYDQSRKDLQEYLEAVKQFNKEGVIIQPSTSAQLTGAKPKVKDTSFSSTPKIDADLLYSAKQAYAGLDEETRFYVQNLVKLEAELASVEAAQKSLFQQYAKGEISTDKFSQTAESLAANEKIVRDELSQLVKTQKDYDKANTQTIGVLGRLKEELKLLKADAAGASTPGEVANINKEIQNTERQISLLTKSGRSGFDALGNEIKKQEGLLQRLQRQAAIYKTGIQEATRPENIAKYNQKLDETNAKLKQLSSAGKVGFDLQGNPVEKIAAVGEATEKAASKTNILSKSFGFLRQAAYLIPGIGLAGIFNLIGEAIVALVTTLFTGKKALDDFAARYNALSKALDTGGFKEAVANVEELKIQVGLAKQSFIDKKDVVEQYNKTIGQTTGQVSTLAEVEKKLADGAEAYIKMTLLKAAANVALQDAAEKAVAAEKLRQKNIQEFNTISTRASVGVAGQSSAPGFVPSLNNVDAGIKARAAAAEKDKKAQIKVETDAQKQQLDIATKFYQDAAKIAKENKFDFAGDAGKDLKELTRAQGKEQKDLNALLLERKNLETSIQALQRDATQSGLAKEASAVDKVNEKYFLLIKKVEEYNAKASKKGAELLSTQPLIEAQKTEVDNTIQKQEAERYLQGIALQKEAFTQFENYKLQFGTDIAKALTGKQTEQAENYVDFLKSRIKEVEADVTIKPKFKADALDGLQKALTKATEEASIKEAANLAKYTTEALQLTDTYLSKTGNIYAKYHRLRDALEKASTSLTADEYQKRLALLDQAKEEELKVIEVSLTRQSSLFKKLGDDTLNFSKQQAQERVKELQASLDSGKFKNAAGEVQAIPPELLKQLDDYIKKLQTAYDLSSNLKTAELFTTVGSGLSSIASDLGAINGQLGQTITTISNLANAAGSIGKNLETLNSKTASSAEQLTAGLGIVGTAVGLVTSVINTFKASADSVKKAKADMASFQAQALAGELSYNELLRERARLQAGSNKLTLDAIEATKKLLEQQKLSVAAEADSLLKKLQSEQFIESQTTKKTGGSGLLGAAGAIFGFGKKTEVQNQLASLAGKTFEEIEKLYTQGKLTDNAKKLFEQLNAIKKEGADIDALLEANKQKANEIFTGTTASSLADSIKEGLKNGYRSVQDFAAGMEDLFRNAILSGFEAKVIEEQMQDFYDQFAEAAQSNGSLDKSEIEALKNLYETKLADILAQFNQIEQVTGQSFGASNQNNSVAGAIKGITEQTAEVLAGRLGGIQVAAIETLNVSKTALDVHLRIERNTAAAVAELTKQTVIWQAVTTPNSGRKVNI